MDACKVYRLGSVKADYTASMAMDTLSYENATPLDVSPPPLRGDVWILGRKYSLPKEQSEMAGDVRSRLWFTYRKNFKPISGTNITGDQGWGCTLRCGQMVMGNTLLLKHLGRDWKWAASSKHHHPSYMRILRMFLDKKDSEYSLHMIAHQGADFGRPIGQWFGPNNVAQALKKLSVHDTWSQLAVHVALDMVVVVEDMKALCRQPQLTPQDVPVELAEWDKRRSQTAPELSIDPQQVDCPPGEGPKLESPLEEDPELRYRLQHGASPGESMEEGGAREQGSHRNGPRTKKKRRFLTRRKEKKRNFIKSEEFDRVGPNEYLESTSSSDDEVGGVTGAEGSTFRSLLLFIPLRLGQDKFNLEYKEALKACLALPQSAGIIGGRPRHALYFIGYHGDSLLHLDPHTTQPAVSCSNSTADAIPDHTYHCSQTDRMSITDIDPSVALAFFCRDEADIDDLCQRLKESVLSKMQYMFELTDKRPQYWGPVERNPNTSVHEPFLLVNQAPPSPKYTYEEDSDGFEVINFA